MYGDRKVTESWRLSEDMGTCMDCVQRQRLRGSEAASIGLRPGLAHEQSELRPWCCLGSQHTPKLSPFGLALSHPCVSVGCGVRGKPEN